MLKFSHPNCAYNYFPILLCHLFDIVGIITENYLHNRIRNKTPITLPFMPRSFAYIRILHEILFSHVCKFVHSLYYIPGKLQLLL